MAGSNRGYKSGKSFIEKATQGMISLRTFDIKLIGISVFAPIAWFENDGDAFLAQAAVRAYGIDALIDIIHKSIPSVFAGNYILYISLVSARLGTEDFEEALSSATRMLEGIVGEYYPGYLFDDRESVAFEYIDA